MDAGALTYRSDCPGSSWRARILALVLESNMGCGVIIGYRENGKNLEPGTEYASAKEEREQSLAQKRRNISK
jgi:hypothetical protein